MSSQLTTAFVNQFSANVTMLSQQMGSLLRNTVDVETINGEKAFFDLSQVARIILPIIATLSETHQLTFPLQVVRHPWKEVYS